MSAAVDLTPEQRAIASAAAIDRLLVTAGPGTGKTHTLTARLLHLIEEEGLMPGAEVLVLSFSRAAVREIRNRIRNLGSAAFIRVATFDSFATRLLIEVAPDGDWQHCSFDGRIEAATVAIKAGQCADALADVRHVVIDEAQDLVGVRAELVTALLDLDLGGFTIFGDPAQGIYDFQLRDAELRRQGSAVLYAWIRKHCEGVVERNMEENFRARTDAARSALTFGPRLNGSAPEFGQIRSDLETVLMSAPTLGELSAAIPTLRRTAKPTAVLCRTNGEALTISRALWSEGIPHRRRQSSTDRQVGRWVADALGMLPTRTVSRRTVLASLSGVELPPGIDADQAWAILKRLERRDRRQADDLDLAHVASRLRSGDVPDELTVPPDDELLVISTIHRAKGLEFDRVVVVESPDRGPDEVVAEEARTLYVGMTRPRDELFHLAPMDLGRLTSRGTPDERWVRKGWKPWERFGIEVRGDDIDPTLPAGAAGQTGDPPRVQQYIASEVHRGDPVHLRLRMDWFENEERAFYDVLHNDLVVGATRPAFGGVLFAVLKVNRNWKVRFPPFIRGLHVEDIDTGAGTEAEGVRSSLGPSGLWLRVRVAGIGDFDYKEAQ